MRSDTSLVKQAVDALIRPPRKAYDDDEIAIDLQGDDGEKYKRYPISFVNSRKQRIVGSIYHLNGHFPNNGGPCVIYLHGNASSQLEGQFLVPNFCQFGVFVFTFDFAGCGCSDGEYVSLGYFEEQDTEFLMTTLNKSFNIGPFVLWGRSMGAATTLLVKHPLLVGRVVDSSFTSVKELCQAIAKDIKLPNVFVQAAIWYLKKKVLRVAKFDFDAAAPINVQNENEVPAVFGHAEQDQFIPYDHCMRLYSHYQSKQKYLMNLPGGHNSRRKKEWITLCVTFSLQMLKVDFKEVKISTCRKLQEYTTHFSSFQNMVMNAKPEPNDEVDEIINEIQNQEKRRHKHHRHHHHHHRRHHKESINTHEAENSQNSNEDENNDEDENGSSQDANPDLEDSY